MTAFKIAAISATCRPISTRLAAPYAALRSTKETCNRCPLADSWTNEDASKRCAFQEGAPMTEPTSHLEETMPRGKVLEFAKERGYGKIQLEDGSVMNFDASVINTFEIGPGDIGEVTIRDIRGRQVIARVDFEVEE